MRILVVENKQTGQLIFLFFSHFDQKMKNKKWNEPDIAQWIQQPIRELWILILEPMRIFLIKIWLRINKTFVKIWIRSFRIGYWIQWTRFVDTMYFLNPSFLLKVHSIAKIISMFPFIASNLKFFNYWYTFWA